MHYRELEDQLIEELLDSQNPYIKREYYKRMEAKKASKQLELKAKLLELQVQLLKIRHKLNTK